MTTLSDRNTPTEYLRDQVHINTPFTRDPLVLAEQFEQEFTSETYDTMNVGDLGSDAKGSGARKNAGKPRLDLIPVAVWRLKWDSRLCFNDAPEMVRLKRIIDALEEWQEGADLVLTDYFRGYASDIDMADAVKVFEFGAKKYKAWNWAKGMAWSVPTGCILRHAQRLIDGELVDLESGFSHLGHIVCNLIMLERYVYTYKDGDDRPPR